MSKDGLEVDTAKDPCTTHYNRGVRSFLGHAGFYKRFIKDFSKIVRPLCKLLEKDAVFIVDEACNTPKYTLFIFKHN